MGHDHHGQAASGARLHANGDAAQPHAIRATTPSPAAWRCSLWARSPRPRACSRKRSSAARPRPSWRRRSPQIYAQLGRRQEAREMLLRWKPDASQEELSDIVLAYPYTYRWSSDGQKALDRLDDGMIIAALPLDITVPSSPMPCSRVAPSSARVRQGRSPGSARRQRTPCRRWCARSTTLAPSCAARRSPPWGGSARRRRRPSPRSRGIRDDEVEAIGGQRHEGDRRQLIATCPGATQSSGRPSTKNASICSRHGPRSRPRSLIQPSSKKLSR